MNYLFKLYIWEDGGAREYSAAIGYPRTLAV